MLCHLSKIQWSLLAVPHGNSHALDQCCVFSAILYWLMLMCILTYAIPFFMSRESNTRIGTFFPVKDQTVNILGLWIIHSVSWPLNSDTEVLKQLERKYINKCWCVLIKFYLWTLKLEFHINFHTIKYSSKIFFQPFKYIVTILSLGAVQKIGNRLSGKLQSQKFTNPWTKEYEHFLWHLR